MNCRMLTLIMLCAGAVSVFAQESIIASESFYSDVAADADNGVYAANGAVVSKINASVEGGKIIGFDDGEWKGNSSIYKLFSAGLSSALIQGGGGSIRYEGRNNDDTTRLVRRSIGSYPPSDSYYISLLLRSEVVDTDGIFYAGFNSHDPQDNRANGIFFGFAGNGTGMDLVVRQRHRLGTGDFGLVNTVLCPAEINKTYHLLARIDVNVKGSGDQVAVWLNPASINDAPAASFSAKEVYSMAKPNSFSVMTLFADSFGKSGSRGGGVIVDELRLGTVLTDILK